LGAIPKKKRNENCPGPSQKKPKSKKIKYVGNFGEKSGYKEQPVKPRSMGGNRGEVIHYTQQHLDAGGGEIQVPRVGSYGNPGNSNKDKE